MMDNPRLVPHVRSRNGGGKTREGDCRMKEQKGRKTAARRVFGTARGIAGRGGGWDAQCARVFRSIPPFRLALRSVPFL